MAESSKVRRVFGRWHLLLLAIAWTTFAIYGSLVPLNIRHVTWAAAVDQFTHLPPLWTGLGTRADWVANILLFIPLAFLWTGALACDRRRAARLGAAGFTFAVAILVAIALEFTQIWFAGRTVSRNDIVAETLGALVGAGLWLGGGQRFVAWLRSYATDAGPRSKVVWLLQAYLAGFVLYSVMPLDLTISVSELYRKYQRGRVILIPFAFQYDSVLSAIYQSFGDVAVFVPVGMWVALSARRLRLFNSTLLTSLIIGGTIAALIEFAQLLVLSRFTDATDIVLGAVGSVIGGAIVDRYGSTRPPTSASRVPTSLMRRTWPILAAIAAYSGFLAVGFLLPFNITTDRGLVASRYVDFFSLPFLILYRGDEFNALQQVLVRILVFAPLGALWGYLGTQARTQSIRRIVVMAGVIYSAGVAFGIEVAQIFMPPKVADATEVAFAIAGAMLGVFISTQITPARRDRLR